MKDKQNIPKLQKDSQQSSSQELLKQIEKRQKNIDKTKTIAKQKKSNIPSKKQSKKNTKSNQTLNPFQNKQPTLKTPQNKPLSNSNDQIHQKKQITKEFQTIKKPLDSDQKFKSSKYKIKDTFRVKGSRAQNGSQVTKRLSIMSWNVWNEGNNVPNSNMEHRYNEIVKIITAKNPDIICLQQTENFRQRHLKQFLQSRKGSQYYSPDPNLISFNSSIILCKYPSKFYEVKFSKGLKSKPMGICEFKINCKDGKTRTVIAHSVHLKARSSNQQTQSTRLLQLKLISKINRRYDISIAAGDYNIDDSHSEDKYIKYDFLDLQNHFKNPRGVDTLPQYQPLAQRTELKLTNFYYDHQDQESSNSENYGQEMMESEYQSQDQFDGYSDSFYEDFEQSNGFSHEEISSYESHSHFQEDEYDEQSEDNSFDSPDQNSFYNDNSFDDSGFQDYGRPRTKVYRRRIIQKPPRQRQNRQRFRFIPPHRGRNFHGNRPHQQRNPINLRQRNRLPPAHQIPDDNPANTWTYMYYQDKSKYRFDRILMGCSELEKRSFKQKVNVVQFQRLGNYSVGIHSTTKFMAYLFDGIVRSPSDHLGVFTVLFLNF